MIKLKDGELADLWPDEKSPEFKALSYAIKQQQDRFMKFISKTGIIWGIDNLDETTLDYLAVELRSMYYDQAASVEDKRKIIKNTLLWYTKAGTVAATEEMTAAIFGGDSRVIEWYDFTEGEQVPGQFDIETTALMTPTIIDDLTAILRKVKNARSHIRRVIVLRDIHSAAAFASYFVPLQLCTVSNHNIQTVAAPSGLSEAVLPVARVNAIVRNDITEAATASGGQYPAAAAVSNVASAYVVNTTGGSAATTATIYTGSGTKATVYNAHAVNNVSDSAAVDSAASAAGAPNVEAYSVTVK